MQATRSWIAAVASAVVLATVMAAPSGGAVAAAPGQAPKVAQSTPSAVERSTSAEGRRAAARARNLQTRFEAMGRAALEEQTGDKGDARGRLSGRRAQRSAVLAPGGGTRWPFGKAQQPTVAPPTSSESSDPATLGEDGSGSYAATPFAQSASWSQGGSTGSFQWGYPFVLPPSAAGPVPQLAINYDSGSVDGRTAVSNNQSSVVGDGFELSNSYIERKYVTCADDGAAEAKRDLCWRGEQLVLVLDGVASELVATGPNRFIRRADDGTVVQRLTGADNGDDNGEHWQVRTADGTTWHFGLDKLPGASASSPRTGSTLTVPVFKIGTTTNDPAQAAECSGSVCAQAWRWSLDLVEDVHGNAATYWYQHERNRYRRGGDTSTAYDRGSVLVGVDYGLRAGALFAGDGSRAVPAQRVVLDYAERCLAANCDELKESTKANWPDVPFDAICAAGQACTENLAPTFFTRKRLTKVTTKVLKSGSLTDVDRWVIDHAWYDPGNVGDSTDQVLFPESITRTGVSGPAPITLRPVQLAPTLDETMANRVDSSGDGISELMRPRLAQVIDETGAITRINYAPVECTAANKPASTKAAMAANDRRCFPVYWAPFGGEERLDWFHKYVVSLVSVEDTTTGDLITTQYRYIGGAGWRFNDDAMLPNKHRTWSQWRGYGRVETLVGPDGNRSRQVSTYFRGLHRNPGADGSPRTVQVDGVQAAPMHDWDEFAGMARETVVYDGETGPEVTGQITTPRSVGDESQTHPGGPVDGDPADSVTVTAKRVSVQGTVARERVTSGSSATQRTVTTRVLEFDARGYPALSESYTNAGGGAGDTDHTCSRIWYAHNATTNLIGLPVRTRTVASTCAAEPGLGDYPADSSSRGKVIDDSVTFYDGATSWTGQSPTRGLVTRDARADGYTSGNGSDPVLQTVARRTYDNLGRQKTATDALDRTTTTTYTPAGAGEVVSTSVANALGHTTVTTVDPARMLPVTETEPNGWVDEIAYDALGRVTKVWTSGDLTMDGATPTYTFDYHLGGAPDGQGFVEPSWIASSRKSRTGSSYHTTYEIFDALLRPRQVQAASEAGGRVMTDTEYDGHGRVARTFTDIWDPTTAPSGVRFHAANGGFVQTDIDYDGVGRAVEETTSYTVAQPDGTGNTRRSVSRSTRYLGDQVVTIPPAGSSAVRTTTDPLGRVVKIQTYPGNDPTASGPQQTTRVYDAEGLLTRLTGPDGAEWNYRYDLHDRQAEADDPDTGVTTTNYDAADQVLATSDSLGQTLRYTYDDLGRRTKEYLGTATDANLVAEWTYDSVKLGQPATSTRYLGGASGSKYVKKVLAYDANMLPTRTQLVLPAGDPLVSAPTPTGTTPHPAAVPATLEFRISRSRYDQTVSSTQSPKVPGLPQETQSHYYTALGSPDQLRGSSGVVSATSYTAFGDVAQTELSMGITSPQRVWVSQAYDGLRRPIRLRADDSQDPTALVNRSYRYDDSSRITQIRDNAPDESQPDYQCFSYSGWQRLEHAWTSASGACDTASRTAANIDGAAPYWQSYDYNLDGSRASKTIHPTAQVGTGSTTSYSYAGSCGGGDVGPHALTGITTGSSTRDLCVNAKGEATSWYAPDGSQVDLTWDAHGRLAKTVQGGDATSYLYDADGELLIKRPGTDPAGSTTDGVTTLFLGDTEVQVTKTGTTYTATSQRYYTFNGRRVAVRTGSTGVSGTKLVFTVGDDQGTVNANWDATDVTQRSKRYLDPFGAERGTPPSTWVDDKGFLGKRVDPGTGLTHIGARQYDASVGRFLTVDPLLAVGDADTFNGYVYANNDPINKSDPSGLMVYDGKLGGCSLTCSTSVGSAAFAPPPPAADPGTIASQALDRVYVRCDCPRPEPRPYEPVTLGGLGLNILAGTVVGVSQTADFVNVFCHLGDRCSTPHVKKWFEDRGANTSSPEAKLAEFAGPTLGAGLVLKLSARVAAATRAGVAANTGTSLVGKSYGLGTVVENPGLAITGFRGAKNPGHALNQIINRGVSPSMLRSTVSSPKVVLRQGSGNYLHLSDEAAVVLRPDGQVVTAYGRSDFRQHIFDILADVG